MSYRGRGAYSQPVRPFWAYTPRYTPSTSQQKDTSVTPERREEFPSTNYHDAVVARDGSPIKKHSNTAVKKQTNTRATDEMRQAHGNARNDATEAEFDWQWCKPCQTKFTNKSVSELSTETHSIRSGIPMTTFVLHDIVVSMTINEKSAILA